MEWRIGCSGYQYPEWKGVFYPADISKQKWFEFYSGHFNTLELNVTFYRFPRVELLASWYERSPKDFSFAVKAPRHITHFKKFRDAQRMLHDFNETAKSGLREKLGCVLFQFPSNYKYDAERLDRIIALLDPSVKNVLEFRHESWWNQEVYDAMEKNAVSFCGMSHPALSETVIATTPLLYYRFHGVPHLYASKYDVQKLEEIAHGILNNSRVTKAFVFFNNTAEAHEIANAKELQDICELVH
jgi:uncharacterized protein YecE (DUF72 family)